MVFYNPNIKKFKPYIAGKSIEELDRKSGIGARNIVKLASNENPLGSSPKALAAIRRELDKVNRYPDSGYFSLRQKLSSKLKININNIVFGNGSDELIDCIIKSFSSLGDEVLSAKKTFLEYEIIAKVNGREFKEVELKDYKYDLEKIPSSITKKTRLIFIANPNNPTGTYVNNREVESFLKKIPKNIIVVFDEAYNEFIDVNDFPKTLNLFKKYNIIVLRTFSKTFGLAGLRIGFGVAKDELINIMNKVRQPFNVNSLAAAAAIAAVDDVSFLKKTRELIWKEKKYLYNNLERLRIKFIPSVANFILIDVGESCDNVFKQLLKKGVIVRPMTSYGLNNFVRVTIGTHNENVRFIKALEEIV
ncbi:MAG: histidinol-phosphate transaminase [Candidatus Omnitrophota bacterium]